MEHGITWAGLLLKPLNEVLASWGIDPEPADSALFVAVLLVALAYVGGRKFRQQAMVEPDGKVSLPFLMEMTVDKMLGFFSTIIHAHGGVRRVFPLLGAFALFILANNLLGLLPGFNPPTDQYNLTLALAAIVFVTAHYLGLKEHRWGYIKKFLGPLWWLAPLMLPIELVSHLVRPLSLSMRLFGNLTGDHQVLALFMALLPLGLPVPFMGLGLLVSILQSFIFVVLAAVYFQDALEHPH
ncbi:MAG TPA: F0F1 ATP synthase subunit A [bacterium]|nr:F0F1 ATP synthase subunit A [bacterium]